MTFWAKLRYSIGIRMKIYMLNGLKLFLSGLSLNMGQKHIIYVILIPQARVLCLWYKCYVPHCPYRLIARQYEMEIRIYYIDRLGKFDYGPAHASRNRRYTYVCQQKRANPMESVESSYKRLNSFFCCCYCIFFVAIASFHKVCYTSKCLTFLLKQVSRAVRKMGVVLN